MTNKLTHRLLANSAPTLLCAVALLAFSCAPKTSKPSRVTSVQMLDTEKHRPSFHFSPPEKWMNDPNGMVYFEGEYHLFYQYYPDGTVWGPMHWGHALSKDMVHWEHLPIALYPDSLGYIFSGSAVVDHHNTSGLGLDGRPPLVAVFTYHDMAAEKAGRSDYQYQGIAYSNDRGRTWQKHPQNPVLPNPGNVRDFRDPKVLWHEPTQRWVMALAVGDHIEFWVSTNLTEWAYLSAFGKEWGAHGGVWECPDLFPLRLAGNGDEYWALLVSINPGGPNGGSATQYFIGQFDGKTFQMDAFFAQDVKNGKGVWLDYGRDNYAGVTWSGIPETDGRRLFLGWMSNWDYAQQVPTLAWRGAMTLPRSLELFMPAPGKLRLASVPVRELKALRSGEVELPSFDLGKEQTLAELSGPTELRLEFDMEGESSDADFGVALVNKNGERYLIGYDAAQNAFYTDRRAAGNADFSKNFALKPNWAPRWSHGNKIYFHLYLDNASAEFFADGGLTAMTDIYFPSQAFSQVKVYANKGKIRLTKGLAHPLKNIWAK